MNRHTALLILVIFINLLPRSESISYTCDPNASCGCSKNSASVSRIVGGEPAGVNTWDWMVSISIDSRYLCGGSILSESWIITAAHCLETSQASRVTVYAGSQIRWSGTQTRTAAQLFLHPSYNSRTFANDIALIRLSSPLNMTQSDIRKICLKFVNSSILSNTEWPVANTTVVAIGWGRLSDGGQTSLNLQQVTLQTIDRRAPSCSNQVADWRVQLCASVPNNTKDTCQGDSGGPLMMFTETRQWVLVGVTSSGYGCAQLGYAGIYTRISAFESWINATTNGSYTNSVDRTVHYSQMLIIQLNLLLVFFTASIFRF